MPIDPKTRVEATVYSHRSGVIPLSAYYAGHTGQKRIDQPEGQFALRLKWPERERGDLRRLLDDGDWVLFGLRGPKGWRRRVGFVLASDRAVEVGERGERTAVYTVTCGDEGHPFARHEFRTSSLLPAGHPGMMPLDGALFAMALSPSLNAPRDVLRRAITAMFRPSRVRKGPAPTPSAPKTPAPATPPPAPAPLVEGQLTANFHIKEFLSKKDKGIPSKAQQANLKALAERLQVLRDDYFGGTAVTIISGYRSPEHNAKVGGAANSQHMQGKAADIRVAGMTPVQVAEAIARAINESALPATFGVFLYRTFVHYDTRTNASHWKLGAPTKNPNEVPTAAQAASFQAATPSPGSVTVETAAAAGDESNETAVGPSGADPAVEFLPGESGEGAFTLPPALYGAITKNRPNASASGAPIEAKRLDWLDVCDLYAGNDPTERIAGRWWSLNGLFALGKSQVDSFLRSQADPAFCELFYDTRYVGRGAASKLATVLDGWAPVVVFRRRPFDREDWDALPACTVEWARVLGEQLAKGGAERFNYFYANPLSGGQIAGPVYDEAVGGGEGVIPAMDLDDMRIHGQRSMEVDAQFAFPADAGPEGAKALPQQVRDFTVTLYRWYQPLPQFYGGTVVLPWLDAQAMVGSRLVLNGQGGPFKRDTHCYIEGIQESAVWDPKSGAVQGRVTLEVTRMQPLDTYLAPAPTPWKGA